MKNQVKNYIKYAISNNEGDIISIHKGGGYSAYDTLEELEKDVKKSYMFKSDKEYFLKHYKPCVIKVEMLDKFITITEGKPKKKPSDVPCTIDNNKKVIYYNIKELNKGMYTDVLTEWAKGELHKDLKNYKLSIGNLTFDKDTGVGNYVTGLTCVNVNVNKLICEYDKKEHTNVPYMHWLDSKTSLAGTYSDAVQDVMKSTDDYVVYIDAGSGRIATCSWSRW